MEDIVKYTLADGRVIVVDFLSTESVMAVSREDMIEIHGINAKAIKDIKSMSYKSAIQIRFNKMVEVCGAIRTLNGAIVMFNKNMAVELKSLIANWDKFIQLPVLDNGKTVNYITIETCSVVDEDKKVYSLHSLSLTELKLLCSYMQHMIPGPGYTEVYF